MPEQDFRLISDTKNVRLYSRPEGEEFRFYIGFPEDKVSSLCPLLETDVYWAEKHVAEIDGYWLWRLSIMAATGDYTAAIYKRLAPSYDFMTRSYRQCALFFSKASKK
jgi:hypothetical protein